MCEWLGMWVIGEVCACVCVTGDVGDRGDVCMCVTDWGCG